jgi:two-component system, NarL family, sensor histidine kinase DesK
MTPTRATESHSGSSYVRAQSAGWVVLTVPSSGTEADSKASQQREGGAQAEPGPEILVGPHLARIIVLAVVCCYAAVQVIEQSTTFPARAVALEGGIPSLAVLFTLVVWVTSASAESWPQRRRLVTLLAEGLVTYLPMILLGKIWVGLTGFFAGSALLLLSGWLAWTLFAAVVGSILVGGIVAVAAGNLDAYQAAYLTVATVVLGLVVFGLARLAIVMRYVQAKRGELAQFAVINERMRFARDLHDLLGYSLSAITLKAELTRRLVGTNAPRARDELAEILDIARQALADVRIVASGYRNISLAKEASSITALLAAAGIQTQVEITCGALDEKIDTVLATVLREAVTNMLRHSTARHCTIEAGITENQVRLLVSNDGVPRSARSGRPSGLENLATRMTAIGGHLTARIRTDGWFDVIAEAPLTQAEATTPQETDR